MHILIAVRSKLRSGILSERDYLRLKRLGTVVPEKAPELADKEFLLSQSSETEAIISSWGTAALDADVMAHFPRLRLLAHAAGSVKPVVSEALWERGVKVTSAAAAIAYGVAEFCLGLILMSTKRVFWAALGTRENKWAEGLGSFGRPFEIYQQNIGIIGASHVGRRLIELLRNFECNLFLYDPYCTEEQAGELGVTLVPTLEELFSQCRVVSLNAPSTEGTRHMIRGRHFELLPDGAVFVNTARGAIVRQDEMVEELGKERFIACLDVTDPEPPAPDDPLRRLPNVLLTPHEAGAIAENRLRQGAMAVDEIEALCAGRPLGHEVTRKMLEHIG